MNSKFINGRLLSKITLKTFIVSSSFISIYFTSLNAIALNDNVVVAVVDTGIDIDHKELKKSIWMNEGETGKDALGRDRSTNGVDDDLNGYVDDVHGWNFVDDSNKVFDEEGHGTHVSGIILKEFKNNLHGLNDLKLMALKYYDGKLSDKENVKNTIKAIQYATRMGAQIINYSAGGAVPEAHELQAINDARKQGIVMVVAAGNEKEDTDVIRYYPASYKLDNMISVAALQNNGELTNFSNYGKNTVDIAAPGKEVYSTLPKNKHGLLSGTSQATAFVSGYLAALIANRKPSTYKDAIENLFTKAVYSPSLKGLTKFQLALLDEIN